MTSASDPNTADNAFSAPITVEQRVPLVCTVPSLKGLTKGLAKKLLAATHCKLGKVTRKKAKKGKRGTVIKQAKKAKVGPSGRLEGRRHAQEVAAVCGAGGQGGPRPRCYHRTAWFAAATSTPQRAALLISTPPARGLFVRPRP